jgi:hypothetical protein
MKNIHILPTDKPTKLFIHSAFNDLRFDIRELKHDNNQNIYITSNEEIKEGDWCISLCDDESYEEIYQCKDVELIDEEDKKIILTTDQDLIKDGVQAIDDEFLEWFVNNPSCGGVEVEKEQYHQFVGNTKLPLKPNYKIIIPKEKTVTLGKIIPKERVIGLEEPKQELLEEVAERIFTKEKYPTSFETLRKAFISNAKWQQEKSYSEEEVLDLLQDFANDLSDNVINIKRWFEKFKNK